MEKSRNYVVFGVLALVVSLVAVSLAYAGFTQTLTFNGTGNVKGGKWDVHFENATALQFRTINTNNSGNVALNNDVLVTHTITGTNPALTGTVIGNYHVNFNTPGDQADFTFQTVNLGNWDAKLTSITLGTVSCSTSGYTGDNTTVGDHTYGNLDSTKTFDCNTALRYELFDVTGAETGTGTLVADNTTAASSVRNNGSDTYVSAQTLTHHTGTRTYKLRLTYLDNNNATITPQTDVEVDLGATVFTYAQTGSYHETAN